MWATCRFDHGLTWDDFQSLTLAQFEALEERRAAHIRQHRFNAALITSTVYNAHRSTDSQPLEVWDFIAGMEKSEDEREAERVRKEMRRTVGEVLTRVATEPMEKVQEVTRHLIARLEENGIEDPRELIKEVFPSMEL